MPDSVILAGVTSEPDDTVAVVRDAFDVHYGAIVAWTERLLLDIDLAHEVVTDAYAQLLKHDKNPEDARPSLYAHVVRSVLDHWRDEGDHPVRVITHPDRPSGESGRTPRSIVRTLPDRVREPFLLRWYAALSVPDIVAVTSSHRRHVKRDLAEAKSLLEASVGELTDAEIEEFFVAEREALTPAAAGSDHWEQIVHQAEQQQRSWFWPVAAVLGVIALVISTWSMQQNPFGDSGVHSGNRVGAPATARDAGTDDPGLSTSGPQTPRAVPETFVPWSLSNAGSGTVFSLGSTRCAAEEVCPTLTRSTDNGNSWTAVHEFQDSDTASVTSDEVPRIQPTRAITEVRFASPKIGFAFGGDLWRTSNGGRSFTSMPLPRPGQTVLDVAVSQGDVVVLTADGCTQGRCVGPLMVSRATIDATEISQPVTSLALADDRPIDSAELVLSDGEIYVQPYQVDGHLDPPWRLEGKELIPMKSGASCGNTPLQAVTTTANGTPALYALCGGDLRGNQAEYQLMRSTDQGKTWRAASSTPIQLPRTGRLSLAASDDQRMVVAAGGPRKVSGPTRVRDPSRLLQVTNNGGRSWKPVAKPMPPPQGMDWVASAGGPEVYAVTRTGSAFWRSANYGKTWKKVDPSRAHTSTMTSTTAKATP